MPQKNNDREFNLIIFKETNVWKIVLKVGYENPMLSWDVINDRIVQDY